MGTFLELARTVRGVGSLARFGSEDFHAANDSDVSPKTIWQPPYNEAIDAAIRTLWGRRTPSPTTPTATPDDLPQAGRADEGAGTSPAQPRALSGDPPPAA